MRPFILLSAWLTASAGAAPTLFDNTYDYSDELGEFYGRVSKYIDSAKDAFAASMSCDTSRIALPAFASGLPSPSSQKPLYVAVGRGTQNYTCATSTADSKPVAIGAVASLYNATCIAAKFPDMLAMLPNIVYKMQVPKNPWDPLPPANINLLGHHFFSGPVPVFNFDTTPSRQYGVAYTKKQAELPAPSNAVKGANGAVTWLYLSTINGTIGDYSSVYRVDTASGAPPKTCQNMPPVITVQYAANYYFFGK
ncbi:uncharacterized protein ACLA_021190 [Aspergillus clavatus NRRL 1]|uniref:Conserved fungal protein n=1 Tax=Aspergillus clavatus (strain ATCC 1007 / CBS 513.65 / DSM 816 / NCTC 3887 / NRRL 1 / QM 1276 / 107) TaxID=344612 RepID=A1CP39_ASPCL|nr:uncharacterized protein ACLA_021190 [Aspergillus clavatus NRRL 1]EAW07410.1 conserved fungal protein [Aspergillus clavatus NRRL 1]